MADRYSSYAELAATHRIGVDYDIRVVDRASPSAVIAPHGGWIEPGTSEIAAALAGDNLSLYLFEAMRRGPHGAFHITSGRFDEPQALALVGACRTAIAVHGRSDEGDAATVWLGGRDLALRDRIGAELTATGFAAAPNEQLPGIAASNICNRTATGRGVQLELPMTLRRKLVADIDLMKTFVAAARRALETP